MKSKRQAKIIEIIDNYNIETQDELAEQLLAAGFPTTQATISRDIRELKLTKIAGPEGKQKYIAIQQQSYNTDEKFKRVLADGMLSMEAAGNILVIKTVTGMAMAVAAALDHLDITGLLGCIAGDDTIMCVIRNEALVKNVKISISKLINANDNN